ncbi:hypothetical protein MTBUT4_460013 [Magnetospirillum sp. UT-4]|nr:hypothetical protein MTBUT4_460013 [Magnetospirillum sp. UT-4]
MSGHPWVPAFAGTTVIGHPPAPGAEPAGGFTTETQRSHREGFLFSVPSSCPSCLRGDPFLHPPEPAGKPADSVVSRFRGDDVSRGRRPP